jgi:hypothetical protein
MKLKATKYPASKKELQGFFTSSFGLGAQIYDRTGGTQFDSGEAGLRLCTIAGAMRDKTDPVRRTLALVLPCDAWTLWHRFYPMRIGLGPYEEALRPHAVLGLDTAAAVEAYERSGAAGRGMGLIAWLDDQPTSHRRAALFDAIEGQAFARTEAALGRYDVLRKKRVEREEEPVARALGEPSRRRPPRREVVEIAELLDELLDAHGEYALDEAQP